MPRKNALLPYHLIVDAAMTGTDTITSPVTNIQFLDDVGVQLQFTGTPNGTFTVQGSIDYAVNPITGAVENAGNWIDVTLSPVPVASGSADQILINLAMLCFPFIRIQYVNTSGVGVLNGYICGKEI